jgi:protein ImuA
MPGLTLKKRVSRPANPWVQQKPVLSEAFITTATDAGAVGFILGRLKDRVAPVLWVQDYLSQKESGRPYLPGVMAKHPIIRVTVSRPLDVLWAMEEGLRCKTLASVIGEVWGDPKALNFTATKRLALRSEAAQTPCWLLRRSGSADLSAARERWRISSLPSAPHPDDAQAPGTPRWKAELFRSRSAALGPWVAHYDPSADRVDLSTPFRDGALGEGDGAGRRKTAR